MTNFLRYIGAVIFYTIVFPIIVLAYWCLVFGVLFLLCCVVAPYIVDTLIKWGL